jgi:hypothetical protein
VDLVDTRIDHLLLHQIAGETTGDAQAKQGHAHQNAEFGSDRQIVQLDGSISGICLRGTAR